jgi:hypothetical protein
VVDATQEVLRTMSYWNTLRLAEKIAKILDKNAPLDETLLYFLDFTIYFAHQLSNNFLCSHCVS